MLESWQFVDPKIAQKYKNIIKQIATLTHQRNTIHINTKLNNKAKQKLLNYNDQCIKNLNFLLNKQKQEMANYFDRQVNVLTKQQIHTPPKIITDYRKQLSQKNNSLSSCENSNKSKQIVGNYFKIDRHGKARTGSSFTYHDADADKNNSQYLDKNQTMSTVLNKTRLMNQSHQADLLQTRTYDCLKTTDRKYAKQCKNCSCRFVCEDNSKKQAIKASKTRATVRKIRRHCRFYKKKAEFYELANNDSQRCLQISQKQNIDNRELIQLLKQKIRLLQRDKQIDIDAAVWEMQQRVQNKLQSVLADYDKLGQVRSSNAQLLMQRKQLLKLASR